MLKFIIIYYIIFIIKKNVNSFLQTYFSLKYQQKLDLSNVVGIMQIVYQILSYFELTLISFFDIL